jgi:hypothetical protein
MARPKQTKAYKKERMKSAKELVIKNFGPDVLALLKKRYAMYRGKDDIQATVYKFLVDNKYSYREISALTGKTHEAIRRAIMNKVPSTKYPVLSKETSKEKGKIGELSARPVAGGTESKELETKKEKLGGGDLGLRTRDLGLGTPEMALAAEEEEVLIGEEKEKKKIILNQTTSQPASAKADLSSAVMARESILEKMMEEAKVVSVAPAEEETRVPVRIEKGEEKLRDKEIQTLMPTGEAGRPELMPIQNPLLISPLEKGEKIGEEGAELRRISFFPALAVGTVILLLMLGIGAFGILPRFGEITDTIAGLERKILQLATLVQDYEELGTSDSEFPPKAGPPLAEGTGKAYLVLKLEDGTLIRAEVVEGEVDSGELQAGAVVQTESGKTVVVESNIGEGDITEWHLANDSVQKAEVKNGVIITKKLADGSVTKAKIGNGAVTGGKIKNYTITGEDIKNDGSVVKAIEGEQGIAVTNNNDGSYAIGLTPTCADNQILKWDEANDAWECAEDGGGGSSGGGASQLSDLTDVNTATPTNGNILMADGIDWESVAQTNITAVGTITAGIWQGGQIQDAYIADNITASNYIPLGAAFGGDVSGTYGAIAVADDSHSHTTVTIPAHDSITGAGTVDTTAEVQAVTVGGDASGTVGNIAVTDDSHAHTTTTVSGLDISDDTNLAGDAEIVLTGDALSIAASITRDSELSAYALLTGGTFTGTVTLNDNDGVSNDVNLTLGDTNETGQIIFYDGSANTGTLAMDALSADAVYTFSGATGTILSSANYTSYLAHDSITGAGTVDTTAEVQGVAVGGDASGTVGNIAVTDDSHAHTTTTVSGLDISADTNLVAGTNITLTDDTLDVDDVFVLTAGDIMSGNLTIQKADPTLVLDTLTATDTDFWLGVTEDAGGDDDDYFQIGDGTTPGLNPFLTIDTAGKVGIGTTPAEMLHVADNIYTEDNLYVGSTSETLNNAGFALDGDDAFIAGMLGVEGNVYTDGAFIAGSTLTLSDSAILESGSLNIQVSGDTTNYLTLSSDATDLTLVTTDASDLYLKPAGDKLVIQNSVDGTTGFQILDADGGTPIFNVDTASEYVGIGTTGPDRRLDVLDASNPQLRLSQADGTVYTDFQTTSGGDMVMNVDGVTNQIVMDNGGGVGIGTDAPTGMMEIDTGTGTGVAMTINQDDVDQTALDFDVNNVSGDILNIDWGGATNLTAALQAIDVDLTNVTADGTNAAYGIRVNDLAALTASAEYGIYVQGTNWDYSVVTEGDVLLNNAAAELVIMESAGATYYGTLDVGDLSANATYTFSGVSGTVVTTTTEAVFTGDARHARRIQLNAEYAGAVVSTFYGSGTDASITGSMTADAEPSADLLRTYYEWSSSEASLNYYTVAVRVTLPADFDAWATSNAVQVDLDTESTDAANNLLSIYIYNGDDTPGSAVTTSTSNKSSVADTWTTVTIDDSVIDDGAAPDWDAAGETAVIYLRLGSKSDNFARVGDIKLNYLSKW